MKRRNVSRLVGALLLAATLPFAVSTAIDLFGPEPEPDRPAAAEAKPHARRGASAAKPRLARSGKSGKGASAAARPAARPAVQVDAAALSARIDRALEDDDLKGALDCARAALDCPDADVRKSMVDALDWFGEKALAELTPFLADPDEEVRASAVQAWCGIVAGFEEDGDKVRTIESAMRLVRDPEVLADISNEYIGLDDGKVVESLGRLIEGNLPEVVRARARETFEDITGGAWRSVEAARRWLAENGGESA